MKQERKNELYFEEIGYRFDDWMSIYDVTQRIILIDKLMPADASRMSCLEVGCGTGKISKVLAPLVKRLTVSDLSENLAKEVGQQLGVDWQRQDACALDIADESFDMIISSECIEHTPNPQKALAEMVRALKRGGIIIVTSPNKLWYPLLWLSMVTKIRQFEGNENWLFPRDAAKTLRNYGITDIKIGGCHLFPWQIPLGKYILPIFDKFDKLLYPLMINYGIYGRKHR